MPRYSPGISTVPLSAYEVVEESIYRPNDTLPPIPFSNLIPQMLQQPAGGFSPQIWTIGDTGNLNNSMFNWAITTAFDEHNSQPVTSFSYYNNPYSDGCDVNIRGPSQEEHFGNLILERISPEPSDGLRLFSGNDTHSEALNTMFLNTFQSLYHLVRLEAGLILENQIYASPEMYNRSIAPVYVPGIYLNTGVNGSLSSTSNATLMAEWQESVRSFQESNRVPILLYFRSVPRLKPLGSAITSVFVSVFAMLSVLWTIFSVIAGALAGSYSDTTHDQNDGPSILRTSRNLQDRKTAVEESDGSEASLFAPEKEDSSGSLRTLVERLSLTGENNTIRTSIAMAEMQLSLARMRLALRKHQILADGDTKNRSDVEDDLTDLQRQDNHPLLVQRSNRRASLDSLV
ncbi:hypothetical protein DFH09DRAFT_1455623 [Mycena vulgaris]|nr:hypothetical protein DFH09DRAFT_1455623 [Mycena vulgaris]